MTMQPLTMAVIMKLPLTRLAKIVNCEAFGMAERTKAAEGLHARSREMNGAGWLAMPNADKDAIRAAMAFDTSQHIFAQG